MIVLFCVVGLLAGVAVYDLLQRKHAILRNFPIIGHFRYWLETVGPELRQYIVTNNNEERPFSRDQRRWVYTSSKHENSYFGFGSDQDMELQPNYLIIKQSAFPLQMPFPRRSCLRPTLRDPLRKGHGRRSWTRKGVSSLVGHQRLGYELRVAQWARLSKRSTAGRESPAVCITPAKGACRRITSKAATSSGRSARRISDAARPTGRFSMSRLTETIERCPQIRAIEIKLSQGAKPGVGGLLPMAKISAEIAAIRGIPRDRDCASPSAHSAFGNTDELLDFVESIATATALPVGIKSAVGDSNFWANLARLMSTGTRGVDFITIDGGEGGTGAGPLVFADHVALPFKVGFSRVQKIFNEEGLHEQIVFVGSGRLGFPEAAVFGFGLGCDLINVGREALLAIGCIQAQRCHTNHCPTGITTQHPWLIRGLDPSLKAARLANYVVALRKELLALSRACGVPHPALITADHLELLDSRFGSKTIAELFGYGRDSDCRRTWMLTRCSA